MEMIPDKTPDKTPDKILWHQSGVNQDGEPFVQLLLDEEVIGRMTPEEARDHARAMTEAAEAAEQDAFMFDWVLNRAGGKQQAAQILIDFHKYRAERTGKKGGPSNPRDWVMPKGKG